jgi:prevent-host-death family protein
MKSSTIAQAKNNLSSLIQQLETGEAIHLTRYGKPVAVMMSENQYHNLIAPNKSINAAILDWRSQLDNGVDIGLSCQELKALRAESAGRDFSWVE